MEVAQASNPDLGNEQREKQRKRNVSQMLKIYYMDGWKWCKNQISVECVPGEGWCLCLH